MPDAKEVAALIRVVSSVERGSGEIPSALEAEASKTSALSCRVIMAPLALQPNGSPFSVGLQREPSPAPDDSSLLRGWTEAGLPFHSRPSDRLALANKLGAQNETFNCLMAAIDFFRVIS